MWKSLLNDKVQILVIEKKSRVAGFLSFYPTRDMDKNKDACMEITALYLDPIEWHQGLGTKLMESALAKFKVLSYTEVVLWVMEKNRLGKSFYEKSGFMSTGDVKEAYHNMMTTPLNEIRYSKNI